MAEVRKLFLNGGSMGVQQAINASSKPSRSLALERLVGIKHHRIRAIQSKLENSPFAACWKAELAKAGITAERLLQARA